jgi:N-methylhydantoinase A
MLLGADIGGTFTDLVWWTGSELRTLKLPTTSEHPEIALLEGINQLGAATAGVLLVHGSTTATNAFLERKGARVVLLTTEGFADVLEIGRQNRLSIYAARAARPAPLVPAERRQEVRERLDFHGDVLVALTEDEVARVMAALAQLCPEAIAICLLHAYANPEHERRLAEALEPTCRFVYASSVVDPGYREYERMSTTVLNAYVAPRVAEYVDRLRARLVGPMRLMGSHGGRQTAAELTRPASMILSGPAGGAIGAAAVARAAGDTELITMDMGGTSTDVALVRGGEVSLTAETLLEGLPLRQPMLDIHTIGAGGGSIARFDRGGALVVGPESAGAKPGPACYGHGGTAFTVTDAHLLLGHLLPERFLGGRMALDRTAAEAAAQRLAAGHHIELNELAEVVLAVANAAMERAIRTVSARRGYDPAAFTLCCFGGAGGLHAVALARALGMRGVLMPRAAGALSALGMLLAETRASASASVLTEVGVLDDADMRARLDELAEAARQELISDGHAAETLKLRLALEMRYRGQSYELEIPWAGTLARTAESFHDEHAQRFGYRDPGAAIEVVRASATALAPAPGFPLPEALGGPPAPPERLVRASFDGQARETAVFALETLAAEQELTGPAIVAGEQSTLLLPPEASARVDRHGNVRVRKFS